VNSYRSEGGVDFADLLKAIAEDTGIERIRYTTSHPKDFNQKLVDISARYRKKIMDYVHLPAQSGNTEVLARMNRGYTREEYLEKVQMIREGLPGVALSTDTIVGFPGETEEQFEDTLSLFEQVRYNSAYTFAYSPRPFTKAARFADQLSEEDKSRRLNRLIDLQRKIEFSLAPEYEGRVEEVLVERATDLKGQLVGRTTQNRLTYVDGPADWVGRTLRVRILRAAPQVLRAEVLEAGMQ
jgi:tRNA-2-methylthio-N6-dimethylallyladenosine synthase